MALDKQRNNAFRDIVYSSLRACIIAAPIAISGCATIMDADKGRVIHESKVAKSKGKGKEEFILASYGAHQRTFVKLGNKFCNESAPDATADRSSNAQARIGINLGSEPLGLGGNENSAEFMEAIFMPSQKTQQFRAVGYRICEAALNGWIDKKDVTKLLKAMVEKLGD